MMNFGYYNMDCMDGMKEFPDKYFDLAIVDPPYGISINHNIGRRKGDKNSSYKKVSWDDEIPSDGYFEELFRVSRYQVIWGGNYFNLPPTKCFFVWDKPQISEEVTFSMCEYAWTNLPGTSKIYRKYVSNVNRIHPTQKPIDLYQWIVRQCAKSGWKLLDTHVGSASSLIAFENEGFDYVGFEKDPDYYGDSKKRLQIETAQMRLREFMEVMP
ncbi:DNA methyltransferase [Kineothrix sedimenti]|uniref:Methyltransferase n=1 Tax=Kineothrix sedimenti TaxID=3123317 RepID=A0ABZ3EUE6_9FIRM